MAVRVGVRDAFIVAYKDGYPYALNKINASNKKGGISKPSVQPVAASQSSTAPLVYKIQLGAFRRKLSPEELKKFATSSKVTVIQETNARGLNIIYAGSFNDIHSASTLKEEIVSKGIKDAFIAGFSNGKKVDVSMLVSADRK